MARISNAGKARLHLEKEKYLLDLTLAVVLKGESILQTARPGDARPVRASLKRAGIRIPSEAQLQG